MEKYDPRNLLSSAESDYKHWKMQFLQPHPAEKLQEMHKRCLCLLIWIFLIIA